MSKLKQTYIVSDLETVPADEDSPEHEYGTITWEDGRIEKRHLFRCPRCGMILRPGSINEGEGFHIDGCD